MTNKVGFIGYGNMAQAISDGLAKSGLLPYGKQTAFDTNEKQTQSMIDRGVTPALKKELLLAEVDTVIIAVKPHQVITVLEEHKNFISDQLFISIAAGLSLSKLHQTLRKEQVVRVMPNVAAISGHSVTLMCAHEDMPPPRYAKAKELFDAIGLTVDLDEKLFAAATAISGSGPAYIFSIMDALACGGVRMGLSRKDAEELVIHTVLGAGKLAGQRRDMAFSNLRDMVTSPGGTTAEGLFVMDQAGVSGIMQKVVEEVAKKS